METTPDERRQRVFDFLDTHGIRYTWYEHPEAPTIDIARQYWHDDGSKHCKNLFFRNHKGDRHYLVSFDCERNLAIHDLEHRLRQGKLSFASSSTATSNAATPTRSTPMTTGRRWSSRARSSCAIWRPWAIRSNSSTCIERRKQIFSIFG